MARARTFIQRRDVDQPSSSGPRAHLRPSEQRYQQLRRPGDDGSAGPDDHGPFDELGMVRHRVDQLLRRGAGQAKLTVARLAGPDERRGLYQTTTPVSVMALPYLAPEAAWARPQAANQAAGSKEAANLEL